MGTNLPDNASEQPRPRSKCVFCQQDLCGKRSKEHAIPQWLIEELQIKKSQLQRLHLRPDPASFGTEADVLSQRRHVLPALTVGEVCRDCNNGWMSELENAAQSLLIALLRGRQVIDAVLKQKKEKRIVSRWAVKTAYMIDLSSVHRRRVPPEHFHRLYADPSLMDDLVVLAGRQFGDRNFGWLQGSNWYGIPKAATGSNVQLSPDNHYTVPHGYKIAIQLGKLLLAVAWTGLPNVTMSLLKGHHVPLWIKVPHMFHTSSMPHDADSRNATYRFAHEMLLLL